MTEFKKKLHNKYFQRCLGFLPSQATPYDSSRTALAYFCISGLSLLGTLETDISITERQQWIDWLHSNMVPSGDGFRGSATHKLLTEDLEYDGANLPATYFSIMSLAALRDGSFREKLDRDKICRFVGKCQREDGSFAPNWSPARGPFGENDLRCNYMATGILKALRASKELVNEVMNVPKAIEFILSTRGYDGGLGQTKDAESHAGLTFCGLASLSLILEYYKKGDMTIWDMCDWNKTVQWLSHRQIFAIGGPEENEDDGGLNGRINKPADTCYAFWCAASLEILLGTGNSNTIINSKRAESYLLDQAQHKLFGGFAKVTGETPDQMHSFLGLSALSLLNTSTKEEHGLLSLMPSLVVTEQTAKWLTAED
ncbi:similar to Saccharomyces cerevisiae YGL155W CDC43 Beta subunit of geranylgeranyltransferase type I [Geotrichum candidum]|uniref:Similar to Saccharomyces cerevisiae YGL155W CDC43 Beta subunit of geranylgeranyltransferase type I n=1 Tax=Geotrichum candidum TaxID=1173061 RepID=A0A0J9XHS5_GEOCN|nr:similar to Saccharomyces cerevisiae YGL155W CDC43 Beta subunit of geranylgeranyltransferase type I [Geotrichum candidum]